MSFSQAAVIIEYTVQSGDTLSTIAQKYRTSTEEIQKRNTLGSKKLKLKQVLTVAMNTHATKKKLYNTSSTKKKLPINKVKVATVTPAKIKEVHTLDVARVKRAKVKALKLAKNTVSTPVAGVNVAPSPEKMRITHLKQKQTLLDLNKKESQRIELARASRGYGTPVVKEKGFHSLKSIREMRLKGKEAKQLKKTQVVLALKKKTNTAVVKKKKESKRVTKTKTYAVKNGDTLFTIARKHKMTVSSLLKINDIKYRETLKLGQKINISKKLYVAKAKKKTSKKKLKVAKKVKTYKKTNKRLSTVLAKLPVHTKKLKNKSRVTVYDIFFKSSKPNVLLFSNNKSSKKVKNIINIAKTKLGRRYVWGAVGKGGTFDCSGFTSYVYKKNGINIPRTSLNQSKYGKYVSRGNLKKGDLIFFDTSKRRKGYVNHVGIYLGNGKFIHASSAKKKVVVSSLSKFYAQRYKGARRPS